MTEAARRGGVRAVIRRDDRQPRAGTGTRPFTLTARADRIDDKGAALVITDYKTGSVPNDAAVKGGRAPQLPLEAAIALGDSGFPKPRGRCGRSLRYIRASGGEPPGEERLVRSDDIAGTCRRRRAPDSNV